MRLTVRINSINVNLNQRSVTDESYKDGVGVFKKRYVMARFEFHACDVENEVLRYRVADNKKAARKVLKILESKSTGERQLTDEEVQLIKEQLQIIIG